MLEISAGAVDKITVLDHVNSKLRDRAESGAREKKMTKSPNPVDRHVGARVRSRRILVGMSQEKLGTSLGLTFQQVQKYEKGTNRIGASRLQNIAKTLSVPVSYFFEGAPVEGVGTGFADSEQTNYVADILSTPEGISLAKAFMRITDPRVRRKIVELVTMMADAGALEPLESKTPDLRTNVA
jgi:transcriptional regulator with XRE-family HTH domain